MTAERIFVVGPPVRAAIFGAYLAARWLRPGRCLEIAVEGESECSSDFLTRPNVHHFHHELGLPIEQFMRQCGGTLAFSTPVETALGVVRLPFTQFGVPRAGVGFHHYLMRADNLSDQPDLNQFSLSLELEQAGSDQTLSQLAKLPIEFGLTVNREAYAKTLLSFAATNGAKVVHGEADPGNVDLVVDCRVSDALPTWSAQAMTTGAVGAFAGIEWHVMSSAVKRLVNLAAPLADCLPEQAEWTRLARAEQERIADMEELLMADDLDVVARSTLQRKLDVFSACGRIPIEDYEVFAAPEWIAAFRARGVNPARYDRMADALPRAELLSWIAQLKVQISGLTEQVRTA